MNIITNFQDMIITFQQVSTDLESVQNIQTGHKIVPHCDHGDKVKTQLF